MSHKVQSAKSVVVTFRVDAHLAEALERQPDKSAFIRGALLRALHAPCPACVGQGVLDCDAADWLREVLDERGARACECCGTAFRPPAESADEAAPLCGHCASDGHGH